MLLRLTYLAVTNAFAALRLLPMADRDKDIEILALRHQITVLERQFGADTRVRFDILAVIEHATRRVRVLGITAHPNTS